MSKGSKRRPTDEAAYADSWDRIFGKGTDASSSNGRAPGSTPEGLRSNRSEAAKIAELLELHTITDPVTGCREWQRALTEGYGVFRMGGVSRYAHRAAYELFKGPIPDGLCVMHSCDNRRCCNQQHLSLGTRAENLADMYQKDRGRTRLLPPIPEEAARIVRNLAISQRKAAAMLGVNRDVIRLWRGRRPRRHVYIDDATGRIVDENYWPGD